jgi:hypothetical protein
MVTLPDGDGEGEAEAPASGAGEEGAEAEPGADAEPAAVALALAMEAPPAVLGDAVTPQPATRMAAIATVARTALRGRPEPELAPIAES